MTFNTIGYLAFFCLMGYIIGGVGWSFYRNGKFYLQSIFKQDAHLVESINKILLVGYYLFNLGYTVLSINSWGHIDGLPNLITAIASKSGEIILLLGIMHYANLFWLSHFNDIKIFFKRLTLNKNK